VVPRFNSISNRYMLPYTVTEVVSKVSMPRRTDLSQNIIIKVTTSNAREKLSTWPDLKHTFGRRLRAAGVTLEDRKALLEHKNGSVTSHYSTAELEQLIMEANKVSAIDSRGPALTILRRKTGCPPAKVPTHEKAQLARVGLSH